MEVIVVVLIVGVSMVAGPALALRVIRTASTSSAQMAAARLVEDRIDVIRTDPAWDSLETKYAGTEYPVPGSATYKRVTRLARRQSSTAAELADCITVTVEVSGRGLRQPVRRTTLIGLP